MTEHFLLADVGSQRRELAVVLEGLTQLGAGLAELDGGVVDLGLQFVVAELHALGGDHGTQGQVDAGGALGGLTHVLAEGLGVLPGHLHELLELDEDDELLELDEDELPPPLHAGTTKLFPEL